MNTLRTHICTLIAMAVLHLGQDVAAQEADPIIERLRSKYESAEGLRATFTQTMSSEYLDPESSAGTIYLEGTSIRIETDGQTFVTDGVVTWLYDRASGEVLINDYVEEDMFPINEFLFDHESIYDVVEVADGRHRGARVQIVSMRAKDEASIYRFVSLHVRDEDSLISKIEIIDVNDTRIVLELEGIELNPDFPADTFTFTPPSSAEIIDLRS